jgi:acyl dehydratase
MPEASPKSILLHDQTVFAGKTFALGVLNHSEAEIIAFAEYVDPLPIHTDPEAARKSIFGGIIASGAMLYLDAHRTYFIPMFGPSIVCGLGIRNWNFTKPHYPETPYAAFLTARELIFNPERGTVQVEWYYEFKAENGMLVQDLELPVLHWLKRD